MIFNRIIPAIIYGAIFFICVYIENVIFLNILLSFFLIQINIELFNITKKSKSIFYKFILPIIYLTIPIIIIQKIKIEFGFNHMFFLLSMAWINDMSAYFIGKKIGKNRLSKISPNKTIEGFIGSTLICTLFCGKLALFFDLNNNVNSFILGFLISISCNAGDLFESYIKRKNNVKDSGNIMKGHGGILDRLDSILIASPVYYLIITYY